MERSRASRPANYCRLQNLFAEGHRYVVSAMEQLAAELVHLKNFNKAGGLYQEIAKARALPQSESQKRLSYDEIFWQTISQEQAENRRKAACEDTNRRRGKCRIHDTASLMGILNGSDPYSTPRSKKLREIISNGEKRDRKKAAVQEAIKRQQQSQDINLLPPARILNKTSSNSQETLVQNVDGGPQSDPGGPRISVTPRNDVAAKAVLRTKLSYKSTPAVRPPDRSSPKEATF